MQLTGRARLDPGIVHHDVQPTEALDRGIDEFVQVGDVADVGAHANGLAAELRDLLLERIADFGCTT